MSQIGVAGTTLCGGTGWLSRKLGLSCDKLSMLDVVDAQARFATTGAACDPELFWAMRGAGASFGVATSLAFRLEPVGRLLAGFVLYHAVNAREVLRGYREIAAMAPDELTTLVFLHRAPPAPYVPGHLHGVPVVAIGACYAGDLGLGERVVAPLRKLAPALVDAIGPTSYRELQCSLDVAAPPELRADWHSSLLAELPDAALEVLVEHSAAMPSPLSAVALHHLGGAIRRVPPDATAVAHRDAAFGLNAVSLWPSSLDDDPRQYRWARDLVAALAPYSLGASPVSFLGDEDEAAVRAAYGPHYARLAALKAERDPDNVFRSIPNVRPEPRRSAA